MSGTSIMSRVLLGSFGCEALFRILLKLPVMMAIRFSFLLSEFCPHIVRTLPAASPEPITNSRRLILRTPGYLPFFVSGVNTMFRNETVA